MPPPPPAIKLLCSAIKQKIEVDAADVNAALAELSDAARIVQHIPKELSGPDKKVCFRAITGQECADPSPPRIINAIAQAIYNTYKGKVDILAHPVRLAAAPFLESINTLRIHPSLQQALEPTKFPNLNDRLEPLRTRALSRTPPEIMQILRGDEHDIILETAAQYGIKRALIDILAPVMASVMSAHSRRSVAVGTATDILWGGEVGEETLKALEE